MEVLKRISRKARIAVGALVLSVSLALGLASLEAQNATDWTMCSSGQILKRGASGWECAAEGGGGGGGDLPANAIVLTLQSACPAGFTEETALAGRFLLGTTEAAADAGSTGGSDAITPAGTVASATTGISVASHSIANTGTSGGNRAFTNNAAADHSVTDPGHTHGFTGEQFDNRPAFAKVIFCRKS